MRWPVRISRSALLPLLAGLVAFGWFLPGIDWGLPSRADDRFLFGDREPWTGEEIIELAGGFEAAEDRGADVDVNPLDRSAGPVVLNDTDEKRAEIVRRYRLQSHQPDEFINFAAIAGMGQRRDLDPKLYQYGGLWIYPIAGLLGAAHVVGYVQLTGDLAFYLDRPEEFGRFYVVARLYSAMWGAIGAGVVFVLVQRLSQSRLAGFCGALAFALLPVVVTAAHEAKPHLAGAVLLLWAVVKADDFVRTGRRREAVWAGVLVGASSAMVVSMVVGFVVLVVMGVLRWWQNRSSAVPPEGETVYESEASTVPPSGGTVAPGTADARTSAIQTGLAILAGVLVYCVTNPYVVWNLLFDRSVFQSNIGNSTAMYGTENLGSAFVRGLEILCLAMGTPLFVAAVLLVTVALIGLFVRRYAWKQPHEEDELFILLIAAGGAVAFFFFPLAAGKPAEYARFSLVITGVYVVLFCGGATLLIPRRHRRLAARVAGVLAVIISSAYGIRYTGNFVRDADGGTREASAERLAEFKTRTDLNVRNLTLVAEPAPYSMPPFDLWHYEAQLWPAATVHDRPPDSAIFLATDTPSRESMGRTNEIGQFTALPPVSSPISWANKGFIGVWFPATE